MRNDTVWMVLKGVGLIGAATSGQYVGAIAQWAGSGEWPNTLEWHTIIGSTVAVGFTALVAFCSSSVSDWRQARNGNGVDKTVKRKESPET